MVLARDRLIFPVVLPKLSHVLAAKKLVSSTIQTASLVSRQQVTNARHSVPPVRKTQDGKAVKRKPIRGRVRKLHARMTSSPSSHSASKSAKVTLLDSAQFAGATVPPIRHHAWVFCASTKVRLAQRISRKCTRRFRTWSALWSKARLVRARST